MSAVHSEVLPRRLEHHSRRLFRAARDGSARCAGSVHVGAHGCERAGFWRGCIMGMRSSSISLIKVASDVGVSFNTTIRKIKFQSALLKKRRRHLIHKLLLLRWPEKISVVEQRQSRGVGAGSVSAGRADSDAFGDGRGPERAPVRVWDIGWRGRADLSQSIQPEPEQRAMIG